MLTRPSQRRKSKQEEISINLVPMLDALVTLVSFLLFSTAFLAIVVIDTPAPLLAPAEEQERLLEKEKPLQLTAFIQSEQIIISDWSGSRVKHIIQSIDDATTGEKRYDIEKFHQALVEIKVRYPKEIKLILKPEGGVAYDSIVSIMDAARTLDPKSDPPLFKKNEQGVDEPDTKLFPEVIFGNIMS